MFDEQPDSSALDIGKFYEECIVRGLGLRISPHDMKKRTNKMSRKHGGFPSTDIHDTPIKFHKDIDSKVLCLSTDASVGMCDFSVAFVIADHLGMIAYGGHKYNIDVPSCSAEMRAIEEGLVALIKCNEKLRYEKLHVYTDCTGCLDQIKRTFSKKPSFDWHCMVRFIAIHGGRRYIEFKHVKGHVGILKSNTFHRLNRIADNLAANFRSYGIIHSSTEERLGISGLYVDHYTEKYGSYMKQKF